MIELEDFTPFTEPPNKEKEREEETKTVEEVELFYREKILELQRRHREELEKVREESLKKGFEEGYAKASKEWKAKLQQEIDAVKSKHKEEVEKLKLSVSDLYSELRAEERKFFKKIESLLLDSVEEILNFLYISSNNAPYVKEKIEEIIGSFPEELPLTIEVGEKLAQVVSGDNVKVSEELEESDFRINFESFSIESRIREKLKLLREEIEREIKKFAQI